LAIKAMPGVPASDIFELLVSTNSTGQSKRRDIMPGDAGSKDAKPNVGKGKPSKGDSAARMVSAAVPNILAHARVAHVVERVQCGVAHEHMDDRRPGRARAIAEEVVPRNEGAGAGCFFV
jgi:hypothetical protein